MANPPASKLHYWTLSLLLHPTEFGCFAATGPSSIHAPTKSRFVRSQQEVTNKTQKCSFRQMDYSSVSQKYGNEGSGAVACSACRQHRMASPVLLRRRRASATSSHCLRQRSLKTPLVNQRRGAAGSWGDFLNYA